MYRIFKLNIILFIFFYQNVFTQEWIRYYGLGPSVSGHYITEYYDKGYIVLGIRDYQHGWIIKTDINGYQLWDIKIGNGAYDCNLNNVELTMDSGLIISGSITKYDQPYDDPFIIKINSCGFLEWCKVLHFPDNDDYGQSVKCTPDGGYILLTFNYTGNPSEKIHLFKFNSTGDLIWQKNYTRDSLVFAEYVRKLFVDNANFLITGFCYYPNPGQPGGWIRPYYIQTDTSGNENWQLIYSRNTGFGYVGEAWVSVRDPHNNYYSSGRREGSPEFIKFSNSGNELYTQDLFPGAEGGNATTIICFDDSTYILYASWTYDGYTNYMGFIKSDTLGNIQEIKYLPNPDESSVWWTAKTSDNKILGVGTNVIGSNTRIVAFKVNSELEYDSIYTNPFTYDSLCPDSITSKTIDPDCDFVVNVEEPFSNPETVCLKVFPNPAKDEVTVEFPKYLKKTSGSSGLHITTVYHQWKSAILKVYNLSGSVVYSSEIPGSMQQTKIDVSSWPRGMYYFRLVYDQQTIAGEKAIVN